MDYAVALMSTGDLQPAKALLNTVLWMSLMDPAFAPGRRILIDARVSQFLGQILRFQKRGQDFRFVSRTKGDSMKCLGNLVEAMEATDLKQQMTQEIVQALVDIRDDSEMPTTERGQAVFAIGIYFKRVKSLGVTPVLSEESLGNPSTSPNSSPRYVRKVMKKFSRLNLAIVRRRRRRSTHGSNGSNNPGFQGGDLLFVGFILPCADDVGWMKHGGCRP